MLITFHLRSSIGYPSCKRFPSNPRPNYNQHATVLRDNSVHTQWFECIQKVLTSQSCTIKDQAKQKYIEKIPNLNHKITKFLIFFMLVFNLTTSEWYLLSQSTSKVQLIEKIPNFNHKIAKVLNFFYVGIQSLTSNWYLLCVIKYFKKQDGSFSTGWITLHKIWMPKTNLGKYSTLSYKRAALSYGFFVQFQGDNLLTLYLWINC